MMVNYYAEKLSGPRLHRWYQMASPQVKQYLQSEIDFVIEPICPTDTVLQPLTKHAYEAFGVDSSLGSLLWNPAGSKTTGKYAHMLCADVGKLPFGNQGSILSLAFKTGFMAFILIPSNC